MTQKHYIIYYDSQSDINLCKNSVFQSRDIDAIHH